MAPQLLGYKALYNAVKKTVLSILGEDMDIFSHNIIDIYGNVLFFDSSCIYFAICYLLFISSIFYSSSMQF